MSKTTDELMSTRNRRDDDLDMHRIQGQDRNQERSQDSHDVTRTNGSDQTPDHDFEVRVDSDMDSFSRLAEPWRDLARRADSKLYMSPEWAESWWRHFGSHKSRSLQLVSVWEGEKLIALAPFYSGRSTLGPVVVDRRLQIIGSGGSPNEQVGYLDDYGISDFLDLVVDRSYEERIAVLFADMLSKVEVDTIIFHQAGDDSFIMRKLYPGLQRRDQEVSADVTDGCPYIELKGVSTLKEFIQQNNSSNTRRRFRQTLRAMEPKKSVYRLERLEDEGEIEKAVDALISLHQERWNELGFPGVFHDPRFEAFFRELVSSAHASGKLWFKQAVDDEGVCAARMIILYNGRYYDYISGFDANRPSAKYRPGIGLLLNLVEEALESGVDRIELLRGEEGYKYDFTESNFRNWKVSMPGARRRGSVLSMAASVFRLQALMFRLAVRELRLLSVQKQQSGVSGMLRGYFNFRLKSVKMKLESGDS